MPTSTTAGAFPCWSSAAFAARSSPPPRAANWRGWCMLDCGPPAGGGGRYAAQRRASRGQATRAADAPLYTVLDALNSAGIFRPHRGLRAGAGARPGHPRHLHRRRPYPRLGQRPAGTGRRRRAAAACCSPATSASRAPMLRDPAPPPQADVVVMETTYGDRLHKQLRPPSRNSTRPSMTRFRRGGNVVIPTFALERAQEMLYYLREGVEAERLPASMQVFLDSPMAISATEIFGRHPECYERGDRRAVPRRARSVPSARPALHPGDRRVHGASTGSAAAP